MGLDGRKGIKGGGGRGGGIGGWNGEERKNEYKCSKLRSIRGRNKEEKGICLAFTVQCNLINDSGTNKVNNCTYE